MSDSLLLPKIRTPLDELYRNSYLTGVWSFLRPSARLRGLRDWGKPRICRFGHHTTSRSKQAAFSSGMPWTMYFLADALQTSLSTPPSCSTGTTSNSDIHTRVRSGNSMRRYFAVHIRHSLLFQHTRSCRLSC